MPRHHAPHGSLKNKKRGRSPSPKPRSRRSSGAGLSITKMGNNNTNDGFTPSSPYTSHPSLFHTTPKRRGSRTGSSFQSTTPPASPRHHNAGIDEPEDISSLLSTPQLNDSNNGTSITTQQERGFLTSLLADKLKVGANALTQNAAPYSYTVGLDLSYDYAAVAVSHSLHDIQHIRNRLGHYATPTTVYIDKKRQNVFPAYDVSQFSPTKLNGDDEENKDKNNDDDDENYTRPGQPRLFEYPLLQPYKPNPADPSTILTNYRNAENPFARVRPPTKTAKQAAAVYLAFLLDQTRRQMSGINISDLVITLPSNVPPEYKFLLSQVLQEQKQQYRVTNVHFISKPIAVALANGIGKVGKEKTIVYDVDSKGRIEVSLLSSDKGVFTPLGSSFSQLFPPGYKLEYKNNNIVLPAHLEKWYDRQYNPDSDADSANDDDGDVQYDPLNGLPLKNKNKQPKNQKKDIQPGNNENNYDFFRDALAPFILQDIKEKCNINPTQHIELYQEFRTHFALFCAELMQNEHAVLEIPSFSTSSSSDMNTLDNLQPSQRRKRDETFNTGHYIYKFKQEDLHHISQHLTPGAYLNPIEELLNQQNLKTADIDNVVMCGAVNYHPPLYHYLSQYFAQDVTHKIKLLADPSRSAVTGAAMHAAILKGRIAESSVYAQIPHSIGISINGHNATQGETAKTMQKYFLPLIPRGTPLPATTMITVDTTHDYQTSMYFDLFQGEEDLCQHNKHLGLFKFNGIVPNISGAERVKLILNVTEYGVVNLIAQELTNGTTETMSYKLPKFVNDPNINTKQSLIYKSQYISENTRKALLQYKSGIILDPLDLDGNMRNPWQSSVDLLGKSQQENRQADLLSLSNLKYRLNELTYRYNHEYHSLHNDIKLKRLHERWLIDMQGGSSDTLEKDYQVELEYERRLGRWGDLRKEIDVLGLGYIEQFYDIANENEIKRKNKHGWIRGQKGIQMWPGWHPKHAVPKPDEEEVQRRLELAKSRQLPINSLKSQEFQQRVNKHHDDLYDEEFANYKNRADSIAEHMKKRKPIQRQAIEGIDDIPGLHRNRNGGNDDDDDEEDEASIDSDQYTEYDDWGNPLPKKPSEDKKKRKKFKLPKIQTPAEKLSKIENVRTLDDLEKHLQLKDAEAEVKRQEDMVNLRFNDDPPSKWTYDKKDPQKVQAQWEKDRKNLIKSLREARQERRNEYLARGEKIPKELQNDDDLQTDDLFPVKAPKSLFKPTEWDVYRKEAPQPGESDYDDPLDPTHPFDATTTDDDQENDSTVFKTTTATSAQYSPKDPKVIKPRELRPHDGTSGLAPRDVFGKGNIEGHEDHLLDKDYYEKRYAQVPTDLSSTEYDIDYGTPINKDQNENIRLLPQHRAKDVELDGNAKWFDFKKHDEQYNSWDDPTARPIFETNNWVLRDDIEAEDGTLIVDPRRPARARPFDKGKPKIDYLNIEDAREQEDERRGKKNISEAFPAAKRRETFADRRLRRRKEKYGEGYNPDDDSFYSDEYGAEPTQSGDDYSRVSDDYEDVNLDADYIEKWQRQYEVVQKMKEERHEYVNAMIRVASSPEPLSRNPPIAGDTNVLLDKDGKPVTYTTTTSVLGPVDDKAPKWDEYGNPLPPPTIEVTNTHVKHGDHHEDVTKLFKLDKKFRHKGETEYDRFLRLQANGYIGIPDDALPPELQWKNVVRNPEKTSSAPNPLENKIKTEQQKTTTNDNDDDDSNRPSALPLNEANIKPEYIPQTAVFGEQEDHLWDNQTNTNTIISQEQKISRAKALALEAEILKDPILYRFGQVKNYHDRYNAEFDEHWEYALLGFTPREIHALLDARKDVNQKVESWVNDIRTNKDKSYADFFIKKMKLYKVDLLPLQQYAQYSYLFPRIKAWVQDDQTDININISGRFARLEPVPKDYQAFGVHPKMLELHRYYFTDLLQAINLQQQQYKHRIITLKEQSIERRAEQLNQQRLAQWGKTSIDEFIKDENARRGFFDNDKNTKPPNGKTQKQFDKEKDDLLTSLAQQQIDLETQHAPQSLDEMRGIDFAPSGWLKLPRGNPIQHAMIKTKEEMIKTLPSFNHYAKKIMNDPEVLNKTINNTSNDNNTTNPSSSESSSSPDYTNDPLAKLHLSYKTVLSKALHDYDDNETIAKDWERRIASLFNWDIQTVLNNNKGTLSSAPSGFENAQYRLEYLALTHTATRVLLHERKQNLLKLLKKQYKEREKVHQWYNEHYNENKQLQQRLQQEMQEFDQHARKLLKMHDYAFEQHQLAYKEIKYQLELIQHQERLEGKVMPRENDKKRKELFEEMVNKLKNVETFDDLQQLEPQFNMLESIYKPNGDIDNDNKNTTDNNNNKDNNNNNKTNNNNNLEQENLLSTFDPNSKTSQDLNKHIEQHNRLNPIRFNILEEQKPLSITLPKLTPYYAHEIKQVERESEKLQKLHNLVVKALEAVHSELESPTTREEALFLLQQKRRKHQYRAAYNEALGRNDIGYEQSENEYPISPLAKKVLKNHNKYNQDTFVETPEEYIAKQRRKLNLPGETDDHKNGSGAFSLDQHWYNKRFEKDNARREKDERRIYYAKANKTRAEALDESLRRRNPDRWQYEKHRDALLDANQEIGHERYNEHGAAITPEGFPVDPWYMNPNFKEKVHVEWEPTPQEQRKERERQAQLAGVHIPTYREAEIELDLYDKLVESYHYTKDKFFKHPLFGSAQQQLNNNPSLQYNYDNNDNNNTNNTNNNNGHNYNNNNTNNYSQHANRSGSSSGGSNDGNNSFFSRFMNMGGSNKNKQQQQQQQQQMNNQKKFGGRYISEDEEESPPTILSKNGPSGENLRDAHVIHDGTYEKGFYPPQMDGQPSVAYGTRQKGVGGADARLPTEEQIKQQQKEGTFVFEGSVPNDFGQHSKPHHKAREEESIRRDGLHNIPPNTSGARNGFSILGFKPKRNWFDPSTGETHVHQGYFSEVRRRISDGMRFVSGNASWKAIDGDQQVRDDPIPFRVWRDRWDELKHQLSPQRYDKTAVLGDSKYNKHPDTLTKGQYTTNTAPGGSKQKLRGNYEPHTSRDTPPTSAGGGDNKNNDFPIFDHPNAINARQRRQNYKDYHTAEHDVPRLAPAPRQTLLQFIKQKYFPREPPLRPFWKLWKEGQKRRSERREKLRKHGVVLQHDVESEDWQEEDERKKDPLYDEKQTRTKAWQNFKKNSVERRVQGVVKDELKMRKDEDRQIRLNEIFERQKQYTGDLLKQIYGVHYQPSFLKENVWIDEDGITHRKIARQYDPLLDVMPMAPYPVHQEHRDNPEFSKRQEIRRLGEAKLGNMRTFIRTNYIWLTPAEVSDIRDLIATKYVMLEENDTKYIDLSNQVVSNVMAKYLKIVGERQIAVRAFLEGKQRRKTLHEEEEMKDLMEQDVDAGEYAKDQKDRKWETDPEWREAREGDRLRRKEAREARRQERDFQKRLDREEELPANFYVNADLINMTEKLPMDAFIPEKGWEPPTHWPILQILRNSGVISTHDLQSSVQFPTAPFAPLLIEKGKFDEANATTNLRSKEYDNLITNIRIKTFDENYEKIRDEINKDYQSYEYNLSEFFGGPQKYFDVKKFARHRAEKRSNRIVDAEVFTEAKMIVKHQWLLFKAVRQDKEYRFHRAERRADRLTKEKRRKWTTIGDDPHRPRGFMGFIRADTWEQYLAWKAREDNGIIDAKKIRQAVKRSHARRMAGTRILQVFKQKFGIKGGKPTRSKSSRRALARKFRDKGERQYLRKDNKKVTPYGGRVKSKARDTILAKRTRSIRAARRRGKRYMGRPTRIPRHQRQVYHWADFKKTLPDYDYPMDWATEEWDNFEDPPHPPEEKFMGARWRWDSGHDPRVDPPDLIDNAMDGMIDKEFPHMRSAGRDYHQSVQEARQERDQREQQWSQRTSQAFQEADNAARSRRRGGGGGGDDLGDLLNRRTGGGGGRFDV